MIYFPMACDILTPGRIKCVRELRKKGKVIIGLLTTKAMKDYRTEIVPYKARLFVLSTVTSNMEGVRIVPQTTIDPKRNLIRYRCKFLASGDGFDPIEELAMLETGVKPLHIRLGDEKGTLYDINKIKQSL